MKNEKKGKLQISKETIQNLRVRASVQTGAGVPPIWGKTNGRGTCTCIVMQ